MKKIVLVFLVLLMSMSLVWSQNQQARDRAASARAARLDAIRQLAESIKGVYIDSKTTVKDFVTQSDVIKSGFKTFIRGAEQKGQPKFNADGTCEVTMQIDLNKVLMWLASNNMPHEQLMKIYNSVSTRVFKATGTGAMKSQPTQWTNQNFWARVTPRGKLMAKRAAQIDAYRNLAETVQGIEIKSETKVKDFVTESDTITTSFNGVIRGAQVVGAPVYHPGGYVTVTVQINLNVVISKLQQIHQRYYNNNQISNNDFDQIRYNYPNSIIKAVGTGVPPAKYIGSYTPPQSDFNNNTNNNIPDNNIPVEPPKPYVPAWADRYITATGTGAPADWMAPSQAKSMAKRAATLDAYRQLLEQIKGLKLKSQTTVKDFVTQNDQIKSKVNGFIKGGQVQKVRFLDDGTVEVDVRLYLGDMWKIIAKYYQ